jgi:hypothetical protein
MQFSRFGLATLLCASASLFTACKNNAPLVFKNKCQDSTQGNVHQQLCYPIFEGAAADYAMKAVLQVIEGDSVAALHKTPEFGGIIAAYNADMKDLKDEDFAKTMQYEQMDSVSVLYNEKGILCVSNVNYTYSGGAHGSAAITYRIINTTTGKTYNLEDFFKPNTQAELLKIGEAAFRKQVLPDMEMKTDAALTEENGFWFGGMATEENDKNKGKFYLSKDFGITQKGFDFVYQQYEIGPYAIGMPSFSLTFEQVKALLKDEFSK